MSVHPPYAHLKDISFQGRKVLIRADLNVPLENGKVVDTTRLLRSLETMRFLKQQQMQIVILSHLGRPKGKPDPALSLKPVVDALEELAPELHFIFCPFFKGEEAFSFIQGASVDQTVVLENLRFDPGEEQNDSHFVQELSRLGDFYVNDAFSVSHRAHGSIVGIPDHLPSAGGFFFDEEVCALHQALDSPARPLMALVAGSKMSTKLELLKNLLTKVDILAIGGAMAHTFLKAQSVPIGASLIEENLLETARDMIHQQASQKGRLLLPIDSVVAAELTPNVKTRVVQLNQEEKNPVQAHESIFDVGPQTIDLWASFLKSSKTFVWNGPLGVFEMPLFNKSTCRLAQIVADLTDHQALYSIAGGGDTLAALQKGGDFLRHLTYASGSGGAFLEWLEGKHLPGLRALEMSYAKHLTSFPPGAAPHEKR